MVHEKGHSNHSNRQAMLPFISRRRHHNILKRIHAAMDAGGGGLKRIDENRELLELLHKEDPQFLESHPWVVGWFETNDTVFNGLVEAFESAGIVDQRAAGGRVRRGLYPRAWPRLKQGDILGDPLAQRQAASSQDVALVFPEIERAQKNVIKWTAAFVLGGCVLSAIEIFVILRMFHVG